MSVGCGAICLIALFVASYDQESNHERGASKQLTPQSPTFICYPSKIRVNAIAPGYVENVMRGADVERARLEMQDRIITFTPMGRWGKPEEIVAAMAFLKVPRPNFGKSELIRASR